MQKIDTLRAAIVQALPELAATPDRLRLWVERGSAQSRMTKTRGFSFTFQLNLLIIGMATDFAVLALAIFDWLRVNQPELLVPEADGFAFEVDVLDNSSVDVLVTLKLTQAVAVNVKPDGSNSVDYLAEQNPLWDDDLGLGGTDPIPGLTGIALAGGGIAGPAR